MNSSLTPATLSEGSHAMQTQCSNSTVAVMATSQQAETGQNDHHKTEQLMYQGAVVLAILLFLVSLWSL